MFSISFKSIETICEFLKFLDTNCDQLPGAAPKSTTLIPFFRLTLDSSGVCPNDAKEMHKHPKIIIVFS